MEGEGFGKIECVSVEVVGLAADALPLSGKGIRDGAFG